MEKRRLGRSNLEVWALGFDLRRIEGVLAHVQVQGDRYPAHLASRAGRWARSCDRRRRLDMANA